MGVFLCYTPHIRHFQIFSILPELVSSPCVMSPPGRDVVEEPLQSGITRLQICPTRSARDRGVQDKTQRRLKDEDVATPYREHSCGLTDGSRFLRTALHSVIIEAHRCMEENKAGGKIVVLT
jgi:hypothetical protein